MSTGAVPTAAAIVALGAGTIVIETAVRGLWRRTVGSRRHTASRLNMLACGQPISYVESLFGPPALSRRIRDELSEHVFYTPHALVQLMVDDAKGVSRLSITVTDPRFGFRGSDLSFGLMNVVLGKSSFWNIPDRSQGRHMGLRARRFHYIEAFYFGDPGAYQRYLLSYNDAGIGQFDTGPVHQAGVFASQTGLLAAVDQPQPDFPPTELRSLRAGTTINTLTVVGPNAPADITTLAPIGVDLDYVRVFRPSTRQRRRDQWRIKRFRKQLGG